MMTVAAGKRQRRQLMREIAQAERQQKRAHLRQLQADIRRARGERREAMREARLACREGRREVRGRIKAMRAAALEELKRAVLAEKTDARYACAEGRSYARDLASKHARARHVLKIERTYRAELRRIEAANKARRRDIVHPRGARARELRGESDDTVRGNLPPELVPLFERVKSRIKGSDRMSRTEAFLHYAEEHESEVLEVIEDRTEAMLRELEAKERAAHRTMRKTRPTRGAMAGAVPF
jgi:hypothetical protein